MVQTLANPETPSKACFSQTQHAINVLLDVGARSGLDVKPAVAEIVRAARHAAERTRDATASATRGACDESYPSGQRPFTELLLCHARDFRRASV